jgi:hypothetical protein
MLETSTLSVKTIIRYPHIAQVGKTYLMTIDLQLEEDFTWQCSAEDYPIYCRLDTEPQFRSQAVGEPVLVLHRFDGTYGEARFLLTALNENPASQIKVTLINCWGVSVKSVLLKSSIIPVPTKRILVEAEKPIEEFVNRAEKELLSAFNKTITQVLGGKAIYVSGGQTIFNTVEGESVPDGKSVPNPYKGLRVFQETYGSTNPFKQMTSVEVSVSTYGSTDSFEQMSNLDISKFSELLLLA